eukprot:c12610_g1_i1.p1 GENE.c12610_g1_i1~~c12610_g1_i1.p1  ORF type:complete len:389 (+),score=115.53 c12610_g1_i1:53-1168(+)
MATTTNTKSSSSLDHLLQFADSAAQKSSSFSNTASRIHSRLRATLPYGQDSGGGVDEGVAQDSTGIGGVSMDAVLWKVLDAVHHSRPLVHCITNYVSMDIVANGLLAVGASPAMIHSPEEVSQVVATLKAVKGAVYINIGTLSEEWIKSFRAAVIACRSHGVPWVLDPLAVGFTDLRTKTVQELLQIHPPTLVKGNKAEITTLLNIMSTLRGTPLTLDDASGNSDDALQRAIQLARTLSCVVCVSAEVKQLQSGSAVYEVHAGTYLTDGTLVLQVPHGVEMLNRIAAGRSLMSALACAFISAKPDHVTVLQAASCAVAYVGVCSQNALKQSRGPGTFRVQLMDALYKTSQASLPPHSIRVVSVTQSAGAHK